MLFPEVNLFDAEPLDAAVRFARHSVRAISLRFLLAVSFCIFLAAGVA
jgi:hypothetical protein